jgi:uncharacterized repeat protein (TIGR03803 family)
MGDRRTLSLWALAILVINVASSAGASGQTNFQVLHRFQNSPGNQPLAAPMLDGAGNVFVTTQLGGPTSSDCIIGCGTVYELIPTSGAWTARLLYAFPGGNDGSLPVGRLVADAGGNLYGATRNGGGSTVRDCQTTYHKGCGTVFELTPTPGGGYREKVLFAFTHLSTGFLPTGGLTFDGAGNLYGATSTGGSSSCGGSFGCGTVYKLSPNPDGTWSETVLHVFTGINEGCEPAGELIFDSAGNLYGSAGGCGSSQNGAIFELSPTSGGAWTQTILYNFKGGADGSNPSAGLTLDAAGNLYGTTSVGGVGEGTVFELSPASGGGWTERVLHSFLGGHRDGADPLGAVSLDGAGNIYGTTAQGGPGTCGTNSCGIVFKLSAGSAWSETALHLFTGGYDGGIPEAGVALDSAGNVYGTAAFSAPGYGLVFRIAP